MRRTGTALVATPHPHPLVLSGTRNHPLAFGAAHGTAHGTTSTTQPHAQTQLLNKSLPDTHRNTNPTSPTPSISNTRAHAGRSRRQT